MSWPLRPWVTPITGADATAFVHRGEKFLLEWTTTSDPIQPSATTQTALQWLGHIRQLLHGLGTGRAYQNFSDPEIADH